MPKKTIKLDETFDSLDEFNDTLKAYQEETFQVFKLTDPKYLPPKDQSSQWADIVKNFKYKYMEYQCYHGPKKRDG